MESLQDCTGEAASGAIRWDARWFSSRFWYVAAMARAPDEIPNQPVVGGADDVAGALQIGHDRFCIQCAYPLVGLAPAGSCPECGTSINLSLGESALANASPEYLKNVTRGLSLVLDGIVLVVCAFIVAAIATGLVANPDEIWIGFAAVTLMVSVLMLAGHWMYTSPDPGQVAKERTHSGRVAIRSIVQLQVVLAIVSLGLELLAAVIPRTAVNAGMTQEILLVLSLVLWIVHFFAMMRYTRWIATRVPDMYIIKRTRRYMWLVPLVAILLYPAFLLGPLLAIIMYWNLLDRLRKHLKSIAKSGKPATLKGMLATGR